MGNIFQAKLVCTKQYTEWKIQTNKQSLSYTEDILDVRITIGFRLFDKIRIFVILLNFSETL